MNSKRTFFAVEISEEIRNLLVRIKQDFPDISSKIKIVNPGKSHITLKFLGNTEISLIPKIISQVENDLIPIKSFDFICKNSGVFPNISKASVLWLGVEDQSNSLLHLNQIIEKSVENFGFTKDKRNFHPHITFGRIKGNIQIQRSQIEKYLEYTYKPIINPVEKIIYFESILTQTGPIYKKLATIKLKK